MQGGDAITPLATWVIHCCSMVQKEANNLKMSIVACFMERCPAAVVSGIQGMALLHKILDTTQLAFNASSVQQGLSHVIAPVPLVHLPPAHTALKLLIFFQLLRQAVSIIL